MESTFSDDTIKFIELDVKNLVKDLTNFEEDDENFKRCVDFTMYHILCEKHSIPSQMFTSEKLDTFATRYDYEDFSYYAENLKSAVETYLNLDSTITENKEVKWRILELFILLSRDTFKSDVLLSLEKRFQLCTDITLPNEFNEFTEEEEIDWNKYLQEGSEKFRLLLNDSDGSDHDLDILHDTENTPVVDDKIVKLKYNDVFGNFPQVHQVVLDEDTKFRKTLSEAVESKTWFLNNQQHSWWNDKEFSLLFSLHPAAVFGLTWDKMCDEMCIQENPTSHQYLEEYKIIRELLWIIIAEDGSVQKRIQSLRSLVSVPSVIQKTFSSIIDNFIAVAKKYREMLLYCDQVLGSDNLQMPFTFQAYASVLKDFCHLFLQQVIKEENVIRIQCSTYTLLLLQDNLGPHLNVISFVHKLHKDCISSRWYEEPPWLCIVKLFTVLFSKLQNVKSAIHLKIVLIFFFRSFKVYANIIDTWLTEGKLYDWKSEFFMKKEATNNKYTILFDADFQIAPFFHRMSEKLLTCSQNVEFLTKLNKIHSIQEETVKEGKFFDVLVEEFVKRLHQVKSPKTRNNYSDLTKSDWNSLKQSQNYCGESLNIAYLIQAFSDQLGIGVHEDNTLPKNSDVLSKDWEQNLDNLELLPVAHALEQALYVLIDRREFVIANLFKSAIIGHYQFFSHVQNLSKMLLMDLHLFCNRIVTRVVASVRPTSESIEDIQNEIKSWVVNKGIGETVLHKAARLGYLDISSYCLEKLKCSPSPTDNAGYTPLHEACTRGHLKIAKMLLKYGADVSASARGGIRPLHEAVENGDIELVRLLLSYGADPLLSTYGGQTPLSLVKENHDNLKEFLLLYLADIQGTPSKPWHFNGVDDFDREINGYDPLENPPSPVHEERETLEFEMSEWPLPILYRFKDELDYWVLYSDLPVPVRDAIKKHQKQNFENEDPSAYVLRKVTRTQFDENIDCVLWFVNKHLSKSKFKSNMNTITMVKYNEKLLTSLNVQKISMTFS